MHHLDLREMALQRFVHCVGEHGDAVLGAFAITDDELLIGKIDVFDA